MIRSRMPKDVLAQQKKVAAADALAFIAPVHFCSFPSILKGWIDRVFTLDFAFGLTSEGWHGDINGRIPLLHHQRALIMTSTIFDENAYDDGIRDAIAKVIDDWGFRYPGIEDVEHVYFYAATAASPETIRTYLDQAYQLGKHFGMPRAGQNRTRNPPVVTRTQPVRTSCNVLIRRPVEQVFDFVVDQCNDPYCNAAMRRSRRFRKGPIGAGTRCRRAEAVSMSRMVEMLIDATAYERDPEGSLRRSHVSSMDV